MGEDDEFNIPTEKQKDKKVICWVCSKNNQANAYAFDKKIHMKKYDYFCFGQDIPDLLMICIRRDNCTHWSETQKRLL